MIRVELFGRFSAANEQCQMPLRDGSKAQELFAYLLLNAQRPHTREAVASVLWDHYATETSKAYLRKALWQLRSSLDKCEKMSPPLLQLESEWIQVHPAHKLWSDVMKFEEVYQRIRNMEGAAIREDTAAAIQQVVESYREGLLPNRYEEWCLEKQARCRRMYLTMRDQLMGYHMSQLRFSEAIEQGNKILECDNSHERTHQRIMWLYHQRRDRTNALNQYHLCTKSLQAELGVSPSRETTEFYERIRDDSAANMPLEKLTCIGVAQPQADRLREIDQQLLELQSGFAALQHRTESLIVDLDMRRQSLVSESDDDAFSTTTRHPIS